jgi:phosphonate transport system substrate-binding protein
MRVKLWLIVGVLVAIIAAVLITASVGSQSQDIIEVSLTNKKTVTPANVINELTLGQYTGDSIRVAIAGVISPTKTLEDYKELLTFLGGQLDRQVVFSLKPTYSEINALIQGEFVDLGFVCSLPYVLGNEDFGAELLVAPQLDGETVYYSYLIVPMDSLASELADLRGASFAFTDPISNSGHLAPSYQLFLIDETSVSFFSRHIFTYSHDNSILAVAEKLVDGAAVDSLVYDQMAKDDPEIAARTRIIARWGPYGIPPVIVNPTLDPDLKQQLRDLLLDVHNSEEGRQILDSLGIDKFVIVPDSNYDSIREMKEAVEW